MTRLTLAYIAIAFGLLTLPSCWFRDETRELRLREAKSFKEEVEKSDEIEQALSALPLLSRIDRRPVVKELSNQLNGWINTQSLPSDWKSSSLAETLPKGLRDHAILARLARPQFEEPECEYLWQCQLFRDLGNWVIDQPYRDLLLNTWLEEQRTKLDDESWTMLSHTLKLWDWTIRNIALDGKADDVEKLVDDPTSPSTDNRVGYRNLPWHTLFFSHGDAVERARVFSQLLFQLNIATVYLAIEDDQSTKEQPRRKLWCLGVPIGEEFYLFEPRFGMPLPLPEAIGVATLKQAKEDANVLRRAKLPGRFEYPVSVDSLKSLVALIDVEPFAFGAGMKLLEQRLTGSQSLLLYRDIDSLALQLKRLDGNLPVQLWSLPLLAQIHHQMVRDQIKNRTPFGITYEFEHQVYLNDWGLHRARLAHFRGQFATTLDDLGAASLYMESRFDEATLAKLTFDVEAQQKLQIMRFPGESQEEFVARVELMKLSFRNAKIDSNYFLGALQFDLGEIDAALDWLTKRLKSVNGWQRWEAQADYLVGRCHEAQGDPSTAMEAFKKENVAQEAGNRIRVRWLERSNDR
jgi:hypothetical protein